MPTTVTGDPGDDDLTPEQRTAIQRMQNNPALLASIKRAAAASEQAQRQFASSFVLGIAPVFEQWRQQQQQMSRAIASAIEVQLDVARHLEPLRDRIAEAQLHMARQLRVAAFASADLHARMARVVISDEFTEALRRISEISEASLTMPTDDGIDRVSELIESGELDEEGLDQAEQGISANEELSAAVDTAADALTRSRPLISRTRARQIVVFWVWLTYGVTLWTIAVLTNPAVAAIPGAIGLPAAPQAAKKAGDLIVPRRDDEGDGNGPSGGATAD